MVLIHMQAENGQKFLGRQRAQKNTSLGPEVVNQLAANAAVHSVGCICQITNSNAGTVFAEAVRQDAVGDVRSAEVRDNRAKCLDAAERLNRNRTRAAVANVDRLLLRPENAGSAS